MKLPHRSVLAALLLATLMPAPLFAASTAVHTTWLWHLHQPVYWPGQRNYGNDHYENAWDTIQRQDAGRPHPSPEILRDIFGWGDRVAAYQYQPKNTINGLFGYGNAGAQVSYSGALIENVQSLAAAGQLGYGNGWNNNFQTARGWTTSSGKPRMDLVNFTYHHALAPLLSDETLEMELRIQQRQMDIFWGTSPAGSKGYFPAETCFTERMIPILRKVGINWSVIANTHLARACADFPVAMGSGGEMCDLPNLADQLNPAQGAGNYRRLAIDRGCSPIQVAPFGFQMHQARYVDPNTGAATNIIVVPSDQAFGWKDSYSTWDLGLTDFVRDRNNTAKPSLVFCAHDGDNAWSGGSSYYNEWVPNMAGQAAAKGYEPTTVEQFINDFPPDANDVVHVEDGGWVYADGDMGSPSFINWHWPPSYASAGVNVVDPSLGVSDKADNWRVIIATENRVKTAQQIGAVTPRIDQVRDPGSFSATPNGVELGWHYYLGSLDSGFVYYGCHDDECQRATTAQSNAVRNTSSYLSVLTGDATPPTVFIPQRHPWNPGGTNFGVQYGYKTVVAANSDFWVWTYAYDVSGITNVSLLFRANGANPPTSDQFKTYAGGGLAGAWQTSNMTQRVVAPVTGVTPQFIADYYYAKVAGISNSFVDYYVSATDAHGNTFKSPIQHVYVGAGGGGGGSNNGSSGPVSISPTNPVAGNPVTIQYTAAGRSLSAASQIYLHLGWNNYSIIVAPDTAMTFNAASNWWQCTVNIASNATSLNCTFNNGTGGWDNNGGANWNFTVISNSTPQPPQAPASLTATVASASQINLSWPAAFGATGYIISRGGAPIATNSITSFSDAGLSLNSNYCYTVIATNSIGNSPPTASVCATILTPGTPATLTATPVSTSQINLLWSAAAGANGYVVKRDGSTIATTANTNLADTGLAVSSAHCYTVAATNNVGSSTPTASVCATTLTNNPSLCNGRVCVASVPLLSGNQVTISYSPVGGPIASANSIFLHLGWNSWASVVSPDPAMTFNAALGVWQYSTTIPASVSQLDCVFNNGSGTWDNNTSADWHFTVGTNGTMVVTNVLPFVLNGNFDSAGYLVANNGMVIYGAVRGTNLYVATWSPGTNGPNDHFIFVSDQLLPSVSAAAPWAKAGNVAVATTKPFLAGDSVGTYVSWFANNAATNWPCTKSFTNAGAMEGTLDLVAAFGHLPTNLYLCAAAYITTNGGALAAQCPAGSGPDIDTNEFLVLPVNALRDTLSDGTLDQCDPARGFKILSASSQSTNRALSFGVMPGRAYQVQFASALGGTWSNLPAGSNFAAPPQMILNFTDAPPAGTPQRFYRVKLLP